MENKIKAVEFSKTEAGFHVAVILEEGLAIEDYLYTFVLFLDGKKVHEKRWHKENIYDFMTYGNGIYFCQVEIRHITKSGTNEFRRTKTVELWGDLYKKILDDKLNSIIPRCYDINFVPRKTPYDDFCFVSSTGEIDELDKSLHKIHNIGGTGFDLFTTVTPIKYKENYIIMSGCCVTDKGKFIYGQKDIQKYNVENKELVDAVGSYSCAIINNIIYIYNDYHGSCKLYYFYDENRKNIVVSNRIHLVYIALSKLDISVGINVEKLLAVLSCKYHDITANNFINEGMINNLFFTCTGEGICLKKDEIRIIHTNVYDILSDNKKDFFYFTKKDYVSLIRKGKQEILRNIQAISKSEDFDNIVVDVSGGMDSRVVFCGLTNINTKKNIMLRINKSQFEKDHVVALTISDFYDYNFYDASSGVTRTQVNGNEYLSCTMGVQYLDCFKYQISSPRTILLNGFYGENSLRLRYAYTYLYNSYLSNINSINEYINEFVKYYITPSMIVGYDNAGYCFNKLYVNEFNRIYGSEIITKIENMCNNYSQSSHCSPIVLSNYIMPSFSPIKSKSLFILNRKIALYSMKLFKKDPDKAKKLNYKIGFDITYALNPFISKIPYENETYNKEYMALHDELMVAKDPVIDQMNIALCDKQNKKWEDANCLVQKNTKYISKHYDKIDLYENIGSLLAYCINEFTEIFGCVKYPLLHFYINIKDNLWETQILYNKLSVIAYILNLFAKKN